MSKTDDMNLKNFIRNNIAYVHKDIKDFLKSELNYRDFMIIEDYLVRFVQQHDFDYNDETKKMLSTMMIHLIQYQSLRSFFDEEAKNVGN